MQLFIFVCFFFSGLAGLIYQLIWVRQLGLVFGTTVFAVTTVLTTFFSGLALGAALFGKRADHHANPLKLYGFLEIGIGLSALAIPWILQGIEKAYLGLLHPLDLSLLSLTVLRFIFL